jgi:conjugal transfer mating pair stabilization protein TraG
MSLSNNTSTRDGVGANVNFDMSQIVASRYQEKASEMGLTAPSLARTDYSPQEQAAYDLVAREIISDYYDQRVAPYRDLIPESGNIVGNVSGPGNFTEADLRGSAPRPSHGGSRNLVSGSSDSSVGDRIDEGGSSLGDRYEARAVCSKVFSLLRSSARAAAQSNDARRMIAVASMPARAAISSSIYVDVGWNHLKRIRSL